MAKQSEENRRRRRTKLIDFIRENQPVKGKDIYDTLYGGARRSFNDDKDAINRNGTIIDCGRDGYFITENYSAAPAFTNALTRQTVRRWRILSILSHYNSARLKGGARAVRGLSFENLSDKMTRLGFKCCDNTLYSDLHSLMAAGLVTFSGDCYASSAIYETTPEEMEQYADYNAKSLSDTDGNSPVIRGHSNVKFDIDDEITTQIHAILPYTADWQDDHAVLRAGRTNKFTLEQTAAVERLNSLQYRDYALSITYNPIHHTEQYPVSSDRPFLFYSGILVYSAETTRLYLLGRAGSPDDGIDMILNAERIDFDKTWKSSELNDPGIRSFFQNMLPEMFDVSLEPPADVIVRFENVPFIERKLTQLAESRHPEENSPGPSTDESKTELIYKDRIRGLESFARYLRGFGRAAIAEEPPELAERMKETAHRVADMYSS